MEKVIEGADKQIINILQGQIIRAEFTGRIDDLWKLTIETEAGIFEAEIVDPFYQTVQLKIVPNDKSKGV